MSENNRIRKEQRGNLNDICDVKVLSLGNGMIGADFTILLYKLSKSYIISFVHIGYYIIKFCLFVCF